MVIRERETTGFAIQNEEIVSNERRKLVAPPYEAQTVVRRHQDGRNDPKLGADDQVRAFEYGDRVAAEERLLKVVREPSNQQAHRLC